MAKKNEELLTGQQRKALELYFQKLADALNEAGLDMRKTLRQDIQIPWTQKNIKEFLWRPVQKSILDIESTTQLKKSKDIDQIYDVLNKHLGEKFGLTVAFPSVEEMLYEQEVARQKRKKQTPLQNFVEDQKGKPNTKFNG
jgi:hypothetical protein